MKRTELRIGARLYHARPRDWDNAHLGDEAEVLAVEPYGERLGYVPPGGDRFTRVNRGPGVLVMLHRTGMNPHRRVVQLAHLRGPWDAVSAAVAADREKIDARWAEHQANVAAVEADRRRLRDVADAAGFRVYDAPVGVGGAAMTYDTLRRLLVAAGVEVPT